MCIEERDAEGCTYRYISGHRIVFDAEGFLLDAAMWDEEVAQVLARESGLDETLTDSHWKTIRFMREFYEYNGRAPLNRQLKESTGLSLLALERIFPGGIRMGARRIAGLPNPRTCSGS